MKNRKKIEDILLTDYGCFDDFTVDKLCDLSIVSQRSELLKAEDPERSFDEYLEKYFSEPKVELVYKTLHDGKERTEKEIIRMYKQAHRL